MSLLFLTSRRIRRVGVLLSLTVLLAGCGTKAVQLDNQNPGVTVSDIRVSRILVVNQTGKVLPNLESEVVAKLRPAMQTCASGDRGHLLRVEVHNLRAGKPGVAFVAGAAASMTSVLYFVDESNGKRTAALQVEDKFVIGGLIGAAAMANAEASLSNRLAIKVCDEVFGVDIDRYEINSGGTSQVQ